MGKTDKAADRHQQQSQILVPADADVSLAALGRQLGRYGLALATEPETRHLYRDCDLGAIPALGQAFGVETVVDERLDGVPHVYFEAGDHEHLVHLHGAAFRELTEGLVHGHFGRTH
jgi:Ala-tRNA(Pro) deacylase